MFGAVNRAPNNASEFSEITLTTGDCMLVRTVTAYPKLVERLGRLCSMLRLSSLSPPENSVFEGNNSLRAFCIFCKSLGYRVVHAGCEALFFIPSENSAVEGNRASRLKCALGSLVESISLGNFLHTKHGNLGRQSKVTLNCGIQLLELKLSNRAGTFGCFKRLLEGIVLFLRRQELYLRG